MLPGIDGQTAKVRTVSPMKWLKKDIPGRGNIGTKKRNESQHGY